MADRFADMLTVSDMVKGATAEMGRPCTAIGSETRDFAGKTFQMLFFSCEYDDVADGLIQYRWQIYVDGLRAAGGII